MKDKTLLTLALIISVVGLLSLYIISKQIVINDTTIEKITSEEITGAVTLKGVVKDITKTDKVTLLTLTQEKDITVVAFSNITVTEGDLIAVSGRVDEYNNKKEIIADKIELRKT